MSRPSSRAFCKKVPGTLRANRASVNGQPGSIFATTYAVGGVLALDIVEQRIRGIRFVANPDKLRAILSTQTGGNHDYSRYGLT
jgi:hypothetical protein